MVPEHVTGHDRTSLPADLAELVCADPDLLALEFDALVAANYPGSAGHPAPRPPRRVARLLTRRLPFSWPRLPMCSEPRRFASEQADEERARARQRGPPAVTARQTDRVGGDA
jgi:hypothetical protein